MKKRDLRVIFTISGGWAGRTPFSGAIAYRSPVQLEGGWIDGNCSSTQWNATRHEGLLELNAGVTTIGGGQSTDYSPFYGKSFVTGVDLSGSTIRNIGDYTFYGCSGLEYMEIPEQITSIGDYAFYCANLSEVVCRATTPPALGSHNFNASSTMLYVPAESVEAYRADEDWSASVLRIYPIGYEQKYIRYNAETAVSGNWVDTNTDTGLNEFDEETGNGVLYLNSGVTTIGGGDSLDYSPFNRKSDLVSVDLDDSGITGIGHSAFRGCTSLTSFDIPSGQTEIGGYAFGGCTSLTSIVIPEGIVRLRGSVFRDCSSLASVSFPSTLTTIGGNSFRGTVLTSITIPSGVTLIDAYAFDCASLTTVTCNATTPPSLGSNNFTATGDTLYVPYASLEAYQNDTDWASVFTSIRPQGYTYITVGAGEHGSATGSGWYQVNAYVIITATADEHYHFDRWNDGSTSNPRAIIVGSTDTAYTATFAIDEYTLVVTGDAHTTVTGSGTYGYGSEVEITATPDEHYHFTAWSDGNTNATRTITVTENITLSASSEINEYTLTVSAGQHGTATGSGTYPYGTQVQISATADTDYHFAQWNDGNTDNPRTVVVSGDITYTASFESDAFTVTITGDAHTTVTGSGSYPYGTQVQISATPDEHYHFVAWSDGDTNATRTITVTGNITLSASSAVDTYTITVNAGQHGSASGSGTYAYGTSVQISATADTYYRFTAWNDGNTDNPRTVTVTGNATYTASIEAMRTISYNAPTAVSGTWLDTNTETALNSYDTNTGDGVLYLKAGVTSIGGNSTTDYTPFYYKSDLVSVDLTDSGLTAIDRYAFFACSAMGNITIPNTVTLINSFAFRNCSSMTSLNIPSSVTEIGGSVWVSCSGLTSITVDQNNTAYNDGNGSNCIITSGNQLKVGCKNTVIPNTVTSIGEAAFNGMSGLASITIPSNVASIGNYAFNNCSALATVTCEATTPPTLGTNNFGRAADTLYVPYASLSAYQNDSNWRTVFASIRPNGYSYITVSAGQHGSASGTGWYEIGTTATITATADTGYEFSAWNDGNTTNPRSVSVGSTDETYTASFEVMPTIKYNAPTAVSGNWVDTNTDTTRNTYDSVTGNGVLYLNSGVTSIGGGNSTDYSPFNRKSDLVLVEIGGQITTIGTYAFYDCQALTSVAIPDSVTSIGTNAFNYCQALISATIGSGVTSIGSQAFYNCTSLASIEIPSGVTTIGNNAFSHCTSLASISVASGNTIYNDGNGSNCIIETSTNTLVAGCKNTIIPNTVTSIGEEAFYRCETLTSITIPNSVTSIGNGAFQWCTGLTSITIPNSITTISDYTFGQCTGLTSITIPNSVTSIGSQAFYQCTAMTTATIGSGVTNINVSAFGNCPNLTTVTCNATTPPTNSGSFNFDASNNTLYVPLGSLSAYTSSAEWGWRFTSIQPIGTPTDCIIYISTNRATGDWVTTNTDTARNTYDSTTHLGILYPKSGVTKIGGGSGASYTPFSGDTGLTYINFRASGVTTLGAYTCYNCTNLVAAYVGENVVKLGEANDGYGVFEECSSLFSVGIGNSVTLIGKYAFYKCTALATLEIPSSVTTITQSATGSCSNLKTVYCYATTPPTLGTSNFPASNDTLRVPYANLNAYKNDTSWKNVFTSIVSNTAT